MVKSNRGGDGLTRSSKRNERVGDRTRTYFTRSSKKNTPYLTRSSTKNRRIDDHMRSSKKNKRSYPTRRSTKDKTICNEGETTGLPIPDTVAPVHGDGLNEERSPIDTVAPVHGDGLNEDPSPIDTVAPIHGDGLNEDQSGDLEFLGYPERPKTMSNDCILVNGFEEPFGDTYDKGVWSELKETVANNIHENIVALASFNGEKRFFACTGCFIEWNGSTTILTSASLIRDSFFADEIFKNLRIEVFLPSKKRAAGILQHYNLHYNIALVRVNDKCPSHPIKIQHRWHDNREVLAVGRIFKSGELMALRGHKGSRVSTRQLTECGYLRFSECRITKAGIGGPLLDFDGKFVGMNFYDKHAGGSWHLTWKEILDVLKHFEKKRTVDEAGHDDYASNKLDWTIAGDHSVMINRWFVPKPFWCRRDAVKRYGPEIKVAPLYWTRDVELTDGGSWEV